MAKPWFMFTKNNDDKLLFDKEGFIVPFGNQQFDAGLGGAHDLDVNPPPNYPVTALLPGKIVTITKPPPDWGEQIGVELVPPYKPDVKYMAYLHLSAINPALAVGQSVEKGDLIGWVGGGNSEADYAGTSNPTGQNFTNSPNSSSQPQVGVALMKGPEYGVTNFNKWQPIGSTPIEWDLDPSQIIYDARKAYLGGIDLTDPIVALYFTQTPDGQWQCKQTGFIVQHPILNFYRHFGGDALNGLTYLGLPKSNQEPIAGHSGAFKQVFERAVVAYDPTHQVDHPPGAKEAYLMHLPN